MGPRPPIVAATLTALTLLKFATFVENLLSNVLFVELKTNTG